MNKALAIGSIQALYKECGDTAYNHSFGEVETRGSGVCGPLPLLDKLLGPLRVT